METPFPKELKNHFGCAYGASLFTRLRDLFGCAPRALTALARLRDLFANLPRFRAAMGSPYGGRFRSAHFGKRGIHCKNLCAFAANSVIQQAISPHKADAHGEPCAILI